MNLVSLKNEVEAAKELLAQAQEAYKKGIIEAAEDGRLEERTTASWVERYVDDKVKTYCDSCNYYAPFPSNYCPFCGAKMTNAKYAPKKAVIEEPPATVAPIETKYEYSEWENFTRGKRNSVALALIRQLVEKYGSSDKASISMGFNRTYLRTAEKAFDKNPHGCTYRVYETLVRGLESVC